MSLALSTESKIKRADPSTIQDKFLVGYQGWFYCPGDGEPVGEGHHGWIHWFDAPLPDGGNVNVDNWPDTSAYSPSELYPAPGLNYKDGSQAFLFSSRNPRTVQRHFRWMAENGVDGLFLQRFLGQCDVDQPHKVTERRIRDEVGRVVKDAAEKEGRVFAIMYDLAGVDARETLRIIQRDWPHLVHDERVLDSPNYLRENGKAVVTIWGFGFDHTKHTPEIMRSVTSFIRNNTPGGAYIMGGSPAHWRSSQSDADKNPEFVSAWMECFDAISPWTVGRYSDNNGADWFAEDRVKGDVEFIAKWKKNTGKHVDYIPVVHPGASGYNTSRGHWNRNDAKRNGGRYLWRQMYNVRKYGVRVMYGAMWDEYDEGTNFLPVVEKTSQLPHDDEHKFQFLAYDVDGYDVTSDWYMRVAGYAADALKGEREIGEEFPEKVIRDWKNSHPRYEQLDPSAGTSSSSSSGAGQGQPYDQWLSVVASTKEGDEPPPPPYTLEVDGDIGHATVATLRPAPPTDTRPQPPSTPTDTRPRPPPTSADTRPRAPAVQQSTRPTYAPRDNDPIQSLADNLRGQHLRSSSRSPPVRPSSRPQSSRPASAQPSPPIQWPPADWQTPTSSHPPAAPQSSSYTPSYPVNYTPYQPNYSVSTYPGSHEHASTGPSMPVPDSGTGPAPGFSMPMPESAPAPSMFMPESPASPGGFVALPHTEMAASYRSSYMSFPPPPVPPRPNGPPPRHSGSSPSPRPPRNALSGAFEYAQGAVDRVAGEERRRRLERGVGSLTQNGSKLLGRFTGTE